MLKLQSSLKAACMAVAALAVSGCSQDELVNQPAQKGNTTIVASFEGAGPGTRTSVKEENGAVNVVWNEGDEFGLFYTSDTHTTTATAKFTYSVGGTSVTEATFNGKLEGNNPVTSYAVYPHGLITNFSDQSDKIVTMALPETFNYTEASNGPMYAIATNIENKIEFKHLAGLLKLTVSSEAENATSFTITADKPIAGSFKAKLNAANPKLEAVDADQSKTITVDINGVDFSNNKTVTFYIPIPVGTYGTLSAKLEGGNADKYKPKEWTNVTVGRKQMLTATFGFVKVEAGAGLNEAIQSALPKREPEAPVTANLAVEGTIDATQNGTIEIPVYKNSNVNLILNEAPSTDQNNPLTLKEASNSSTSTGTLNAVTIAIPPVTNQENGHYLTVEMPKTTVELDVADGNTGTTTVYKKIVATTASNTLVIKKGVKVEALEVKGGNVRVAGEITSITNSSGKTITLYKETGAIVTTVGDNITVTEDNNLMDAAKNGGKCTLKADVSLSEPLVVEKEMTLDLNGHSIKSLNNESLKKVLNTSDALILVRRGASLTIDDSSTGKTGSIDGSSVASIYAAVKLTDKEDGGTGTDATLIVNGGTLKGYYYGICGNGTRHGTSITINGGTIEAANGTDGTGIYHPQEGTLTVKGGTISGYNTGIEMRSGILTVDGDCTIKSTATEFKKESNKSGTTITGAAVAVSQHTTNKNPFQTFIKKGTLQGVYALYEEDLQDENVSGISIEVTGGDLYGQVFSENCKDFIGGGTISDLKALEYLAEGKKVEIGLNTDANIIGKGIEVPENKEVELDLGERTITAGNIKADRISVYGKLKLIGKGNQGLITTDKTSTKAGNTGLVAVYGENASMTVENVKIDAVRNNDTDGQYGVVVLNGADFTMISGYINAKTFALCGNGTFKTQDSQINITGGSLISTGDYAIYLPQAGTTSITAGRIEGACGGIAMRSGTLAIKGNAFITGQGTGTPETDGGDGTSGMNNAVINIGEGKAGTYGNCKVDISGAEFVAKGNSAMIVKGTPTSGNTIDVNVSGGTFSDTGVLDYLTDNANVKVNFNKDNEITALYIPKGQTVAMNLNEKKLTVKADEVPETIIIDGKNIKNKNVLISGTLTLKNGSIENNKEGTGLISNAAKLELDNITYTTNNTAHYGIFNNPNVAGSSITVKNNSTITSVYYAIGTNALDNPVGSTTITLENSTFIAKETALMVNIPSMVTVKGCTFEGGWQGVFLRGGTATFADSHIKLVFANDYATSSIAQSATWGSGNQAPAAALTAGNRSTSAYDYKTKITLNNTTFSNSGTDKGSKVATGYPAIYIDTESASSKPSQGVELTYDTASENSFKTVGQGLIIGNKDNVKVNGATPQ